MGFVIFCTMLSSTQVFYEPAAGGGGACYERLVVSALHAFHQTSTTTP